MSALLWVGEEEQRQSPPSPRAWERKDAPFSHRVVDISLKTLVLQVSALSRNDAVARDWLLPKARIAGDAVAVTFLSTPGMCSWCSRHRPFLREMRPAIWAFISGPLGSRSKL